MSAREYTTIEQAIPMRTLKRSNRSVWNLFFNVHMGNGHRGLAEIAKGSGIDVDMIEPKEYLVFINPSLTAAKVYANGQVIAHIKKKISAQIIEQIPLSFGGARMNFTDNQRKEIAKYMGEAH